MTENVLGRKFDAHVARPLPLDPRALTPARIGLETVGVSLASKHALDLAEANSLARDAVHAVLPVSELLAGLRERNLVGVAVRSGVTSRAEYLRRPDLGRQLASGAAELLAAHSGGRAVDGLGQSPARLTVVIADGLSALAAERHALAVVDALLSSPELSADSQQEWALTPIVLAEQARVALGDAVAQAMQSDAVVVLLGERPGLSSPDSLGAYITWKPRVGTTDAERSCVSNIRTEGLGYGEAAARIVSYCVEGRRAGATGVHLPANRPPELQG